MLEIPWTTKITNSVGVMRRINRKPEISDTKRKHEYFIAKQQILLMAVMVLGGEDYQGWINKTLLVWIKIWYGLEQLRTKTQVILKRSISPTFYEDKK